MFKRLKWLLRKLSIAVMRLGTGELHQLEEGQCGANLISGHTEVPREHLIHSDAPPHRPAQTVISPLGKSRPPPLCRGTVIVPSRPRVSSKSLSSMGAPP